MVLLSALALVPYAVGCSSSQPGGGNGGDGGNGYGDGSVLGDGSANNGDGGGFNQGCGTVYAIIRDFKFWDSMDTDTLPDFENKNHDEPDYDFSSGAPVWNANPNDSAWNGCDVTNPYLDKNLDSQGKPQFLSGVDISPCNTIQSANGVTGAEGFALWYRDSMYSKGPFMVPIPDQDPSPDRFLFDATTTQFFPIDGMGWGNQGEDHNFSFTTEIDGTFHYYGGETFTFSGDDDVWVFINNKLAVDIGGVHSSDTGTVNLDDEASYLGITPGNNYSIRLFHAERHTSASHFRFETTIKCLVLG